MDLSGESMKSLKLVLVCFLTLNCLTVFAKDFKSFNQKLLDSLSDDMEKIESHLVQKQSKKVDRSIATIDQKNDLSKLSVKVDDVSRFKVEKRNLKVPSDPMYHEIRYFNNLYQNVNGVSSF
jgi:hypothetical protein